MARLAFDRDEGALAAVCTTDPVDDPICTRRTNQVGDVGIDSSRMEGLIDAGKCVREYAWLIYS